MHRGLSLTLRLLNRRCDSMANGSRALKEQRIISKAMTSSKADESNASREAANDDNSALAGVDKSQDDIFARFSLDGNLSEREIFLDSRPLNKTEREAFKRIQYEYNIWKYVDAHFPDSLTDRDVGNLLKLKSPMDRLKYLESCYIRLQERSNLINSKSEIRKDFFSRQKSIRQQRHDVKHIFYGFGGNFIFQRFEKQLFRRWNYARYVTQYPSIALTVVLDASLSHQCCLWDQQQTANSVYKACMLNVEHRQPAKLIVTGLDTDSPFHRNILNKVFLPTGLDDHPFEHTSRSYIDLFPADRLVYLTPDSNVLLKTVDEDKIYILGALNDRKNRLCSATLSEARKFGIATARLPIDLHIDWSRGIKSLDVHQVHGILLDVCLTGDWRAAFFKNLLRFNYETFVETSVDNQSKKKECAQWFHKRNNFLLGLVSDQ